MRLTDQESRTLIMLFQKYFGEADHLWLFGSLVDDTKRGEDIDLYIETKETDVDSLYEKKIKFVSAIWDQIGEQKIDVVLNILSNPISVPIYKIAKETGILLI
jgi:predicted nucleotidyltransferase